MKNVNPINFKLITNDGFIGFNNNVVAAAESINLKDIRSQVDTYKAAIRKFADYTSSVSEAAAKRNASKLGSKRIVAFRNFRNLVKALCGTTDESRSALAKEIWEYIKPLSKVGSADQKSLTGILDTAIVNVQVILEKDDNTALVAGSDLEGTFNALLQAQEAFSKANQVRAEERRIREEVTNKILRNECIAAFLQLLNFAQYNVATKGDEGCKDFIDKVNVFIANSRSLYKARSKARAKAKESTPPTTEAQAAEVDVASNSSANTVAVVEGRVNAA